MTYRTERVGAPGVIASGYLLLDTVRCGATRNNVQKSGKEYGQDSLMGGGGGAYPEGRHRSKKVFVAKCAIRYRKVKYGTLIGMVLCRMICRYLHKWHHLGRGREWDR